MMKWPVPISLLLCGSATVLAGCQHLPYPFGSMAMQTPKTAPGEKIPTVIPAEVAVSPSPIVPVSVAVTRDDKQTAALKADNAKLKNELAGVLRENARLKKDLADAMDDNALLKDLAEKKQR
jgi:hypothetical protein